MMYAIMEIVHLDLPRIVMIIMSVQTILVIAILESVCTTLTRNLVAMVTLVHTMFATVEGVFQELERIVTMVMFVLTTCVIYTLVLVFIATIMPLAPMATVVHCMTFVLMDIAFPVQPRIVMTTMFVPMIGVIQPLEVVFTIIITVPVLMEIRALAMMFVLMVSVPLVIPKTVTMAITVLMIPVTFRQELVSILIIILLVRIMMNVRRTIFVQMVNVFLVSQNPVTMTILVPTIPAIPKLECAVIIIIRLLAPMMMPVHLMMSVMTENVFLVFLRIVTMVTYVLMILVILILDSVCISPTRNLARMVTIAL